MLSLDLPFLNVVIVFFPRQHELWALLNFLVPDVFESSEQFDEWFNLDIEDKDEKNKLISQLHKILRPFMRTLRRNPIGTSCDNTEISP